MAREFGRSRSAIARRSRRPLRPLRAAPRSPGTSADVTALGRQIHREASGLRRQFDSPVRGGQLSPRSNCCAAARPAQITVDPVFTLEYSFARAAQTHGLFGPGPSASDSTMGPSLAN